jgi:hypothetical protein
MKNPGGENQESDIFSCIDIASLKPIVRKPNTKIHIGKRVQCDFGIT